MHTNPSPNPNPNPSPNPNPNPNPPSASNVPRVARSRRRRPHDELPPRDVTAIRRMSIDEVRANKYVVVDQDVYDVRPMMHDHPSGAAVIERHLGTDISRVFHRVRHSRAARAWLARLRVGRLHDAGDDGGRKRGTL